MANVVDKFGVKFWNGNYYCNVVFPDGTKQELNSTGDLDFAGWQSRIQTAWEAHIAPPPPVEPSLTAATTQEMAAEIKKRGLMAKDLGLNGTAQPIG
jgi:hypothetical protein